MLFRSVQNKIFCLNCCIECCVNNWSPNSWAGGARTAENSWVGGARTAENSWAGGARTSTAAIGYGGGDNSQCVVVLGKALQKQKKNLTKGRELCTYTH